MASSQPIVVMIRPRGGNFVYSKEEIQIMTYDIEMCKSLNILEIITGVLTEERTIDIETMKNLIQLAAPMQVCFHMAIDECDDYDYAIQQLIKLGIKRVLTKGGKYKSALEGKQSLKEYISRYPEITFLAGGGITKDNYVELCEYCQLKEVHGTKIV